MPAAIVLELTALQEGAYHFDTGKGVHGWWFQRWLEHAPAVASEMHQSNRSAAFTLSPLMGLPHATDGFVKIFTDQSAWLRITTLDETLDGLVLQADGWLEKLPGMVVIENIPWRIQGIHSTHAGHPWAGRASYADLRSLLDMNNPPSRWWLEFGTPMTFNGKKTQFPFPLPEMLVRSWMDRWNAFAPFTLPDEVLQAAREGLGVTGYRLRTQTLIEGKRRVIGCQGDLSLRAIEQPPGLLLALNLLFEFAFFCGSGYHTTQGMGLTRLRKPGD